MLTQVIIVVLIITYAYIYLSNIKQKTIKPILATWIFLSMATLMSFITNYYESGDAGLLANAYNIVDMLATITICSFLITQKNIRKTFTNFEKSCIGIVVIICVIWFITNNNVLAHILLQIILLIAYLPTLAHLWCAEKNSESITMWSLNGVAALFGLIEPVRTGAILPIIYGMRGAISCFLVVLLGIRIRMHTSKPSKKTNLSEL
jgi:hypothetical protein